MAYVPNAGDTSQPVESQSVESAALEFRTLKTLVARGLRVPEATIGDIPTAAARAGKVLGFDAAGQPVGVEVSGVSDPSLRADLAASGGVGLVNGAAASGVNTDITSIAGNAATATTAANCSGNAATASAANNGYFTAQATYPKLELHKTGVVAGQWAINAAGNYVFEATSGNGVAISTLLTLTPTGLLTSLNGFGGNAATATKLAGDTGSAPSYSCRAWVNFNGTGTVSIRSSGNVSSITDNGVGDYTINFTTAMPDANYAVSGSAGNNSALTFVVSPAYLSAPTAASCRIAVLQLGAGLADVLHNYVSINR